MEEEKDTCISSTRACFLSKEASWLRAAAAQRLYKEAAEDRPRRHTWAGTAGVVSKAQLMCDLLLWGCAAVFCGAVLLCCNVLFY